MYVSYGKTGTLRREMKHHEPIIMQRKNHNRTNYPRILAVLEGNGIRPSHKGPGINTDAKVMYTLNSVEVHGVIYEQKS